ncbi:Alpha-(1,3)-fucosyltransferase C [Toxocara canis]|uniref:Fucosyltransferase n=1 Tax=Toxocara canis TaxID=6265 RepID=A0A0B2V6D5_TOXCA|nr:Alpha-(1,3)-fucosyltransferase C [Toxocara canis]
MRSVHALHKHRFLMLSAMCILIVFLTACNAYVWSTTPRSMECNEKARNGSEVFIRDAPADEHPRIIVWTKYFGSERQLPNLQNGGSCLKHCVLTSERTDYENATAILFHWNDLDPYDLPARRDWRQRYVYENLESPLNTARKYDNIHNSWALNFFNWTMTYRSDSDIYAPYDRLLPKSAPPLPGHEYHAYNWSEVRDAISKKDKLAFQLVSNCYSRSGREAIVNELQKHIEVSVRGQCSNFVCDTACEKEMLEPAIIQRCCQMDHFWLSINSLHCISSLYNFSIWLQITASMKDSSNGPRNTNIQRSISTTNFVNYAKIYTQTLQQRSTPIFKNGGKVI